MPNDITSPFRRRDYVKITVLGFAITALWQSLHIIVLPRRLEDLVSASQANTYLAILTACGLLLAMFVQPIAGAISDRSNFRWGRRRPFIFFGIIAAMILLTGIGWAGSFLAIFFIICLLQVATNTAQGPYQAFIPEFVPVEKHGTASGLKGLFELAGGVVFVLITGWLYSAKSGTAGLWQVLGALEVALLITMLATVLFVHERPSPAVNRKSPFTAFLHVFSKDVWKNSSFVWFLVSRLFVYMAFTTIQQFAYNYLKNVVGIADPTAATSRFTAIGAISMLVAVWPAGFLSDRIGRKLLTAISGILGALGIAIIAYSQEYNTILWAAGIIGVAMGIFNSTNWALATDFAPEHEEARYLGIANMATAGGAVLARLIGPAIDFFNNRSPLMGYDFMLIVCIVYFVIGAGAVIGVRRRR